MERLDRAENFRLQPRPFFVCLRVCIHAFFSSFLRDLGACCVRSQSLGEHVQVHRCTGSLHLFRSGMCAGAQTRATATACCCRNACGKKPAAVAVKPFADGKLTVAAVESVVRQAADMAERSDYRGQCALAGPEVTFKVTDHSTTPATVLSGGRREICAAQRDSAQAVDAMGLKASVRTGKLAVALNPDSTKATVKYESATTLTHQGQVVMQLKCVREEVLGVYDGEILYAQALATCRPQ